MRTARVVVDGYPPRGLGAGQVLVLDLDPGPHEVRVLAGGARSHLHRVVLAEAGPHELAVATSWPDDLPDSVPVPALVAGDGRPAPVAWQDGVPFDQSPWPFWAFLLAFVAPPTGLLVSAVALRRPGLSTVSRGLVVTGLVAGAVYVLGLVAGVVWIFTSEP